MGGRRDAILKFQTSQKNGLSKKRQIVSNRRWSAGEPPALVDGSTQPAQVAGMAEQSPRSPRPPTAAGARNNPLPMVRLELRQGAARSAVYDLSELGFLIGSVPGCDLRLPGADRPAVLCLISRSSDGVAIRKLAPAQPILLNGQAFSTSPLADGDRLTLAGAELVVRIQGVA